MTVLQVVGVVLAALAALLHVLFFVVETVLFSRPVGRRLFGVRDDQLSPTLTLFAANQGVYNLGLALVVVAGIVLLVLDPHSLVGTAVIVAGAGVMLLAGVSLALTSRRMLRAALVQAVPPALAILLLIGGLPA